MTFSLPTLIIRTLVLSLATFCISCTTVEKHQSPVELRAASNSSKADWQRLDYHVGGLDTWVAPEPTIVLDDIVSARRSIDDFGRPTVILTFTDDARMKMTRLSIDRSSRPVAVLVDGKIIAAPILMQEMGDTLTIGFGTRKNAAIEATELADRINKHSTSKTN
jgi:preprotein translocase subunit SecD